MSNINSRFDHGIAIGSTAKSITGQIDLNGTILTASFDELNNVADVSSLNQDIGNSTTALTADLGARKLLFSSSSDITVTVDEDMSGVSLYAVRVSGFTKASKVALSSGNFVLANTTGVAANDTLTLIRSGFATVEFDENARGMVINSSSCGLSIGTS